MNMKKMTLANLMVAIVTLGASTLASAEGVEVDNIKAKTTVNGAVLQGALGDGNELNTTIGGVSGNVKGKNIDLETNVNGAVTNIAIGNKNKSNLNIGGVSSH